MLGFNVFDPLEVVKSRKQTPRLWKISHKSEKRIRNGINPSAMDNVVFQHCLEVKSNDAKFMDVNGSR